MPLQRQSSVHGCGVDSEVMSHHDSFEEIVPASSPTQSSSSSWKLLRNIFTATRSFSLGKEKDKGKDDTNSNNNNNNLTVESPTTKKHRLNAANDQASFNASLSPGLIRRLSIGRQRKSSSSKSPTLSLRSRKTSSASSHENVLHYVVSESDIPTLKSILTTKKVDINLMRAPGLSPLHTACILGDLEIVEILVEHGADIKLKTWSGLSPLQITTLFGHFDVAQYLITKGANSQEVQDGFTSDTKLISTMLCIS